jgi:predicted transcriptional regulator
MDLAKGVRRIVELLDVDEFAVLSRDKTPPSVRARRLLCHFAHSELGLTTVDIAKRLGINQSVVSRAARRGSDIARQHEYVLLGESIKT